MNGDESSGRAGTEAAAWVARLNNRSVSTNDLEDFYRWRRDPVNSAAYSEADRAWHLARPLGGDAEIGAALDEVLARPIMVAPWWRNWRWQFGGLGGAAIALALVLWITARPLVYETAIGEQSVVKLADGSKIHLDTHSRVEVRFSGGERDLTLSHGRAMFEVAKDKARPFVVTISGSTVRALGTKFAVDDDRRAIGVVLLEGLVRVDGSEGGRTFLKPGQGVEVVGGRPGGPVALDADAATAWALGKLIFRDTPLTAAVAEINRYSTTPIVLVTRRAEQLRVNGVFDAGNVDAFVTATTAVTGLRARRTSDGGFELSD